MKKDTLAPFLFHQGTNYRSYEYMGCHAGARKDNGEIIIEKPVTLAMNEMAADIED